MGARPISRSSGDDDSLVDVQGVTVTDEESVVASRKKANLQQQGGGHRAEF
jgi:hypothetical protein